MSRQIDDSKPLSDEDRAFLLGNGGENRVRAIDAATGVDPSPPPFMTGGEPGLQTGVPMGTINAPGLSPAQVAANVGASNPWLAISQAPTELLEAELARRKGASIEESVAEDEYSTGEVVESDDYPYGDWTAKQLKAQLGYRELSQSGNKAELAQRLRDNDIE